MEKNHKNPNCWSELPQDLVIKVFERLAFADFKRAKSVCSFWNSASRQSVPKSTQVPWLILFPDDINNTSLRLFNPEEKDKLYKTQPLGVEIANSYSRATYRNWLLKQDFHWNLYIVNIFTHERINLPPMESQLGVTNVERTEADWLVNFDLVSLTYSNILIRSPVFWIDEKTKEYIVLYGLDQWSLAYSKTGDNFWNQVPEISDCNCMVYKDHKLYCISKRNIFTILDFSGQIPQQTFSILLNASLFLNPCILWKRLVLTITGDVLMIERVSRALSHINGKSIRIFKIYSSSSGFLEKHERVDSLGDETILLDLGITVLANKVEGLKRNSIYSSRYFCLDNNEFFIFNLETNKMEGLHKFDFDCSLAQWFLPSL